MRKKKKSSKELVYTYEFILSSHSFSAESKALASAGNFLEQLFFGQGVSTWLFIRNWQTQQPSEMDS